MRARKILPTNADKTSIITMPQTTPGVDENIFRITRNTVTSAAYVIENTTPGSSVVTPSINSDSASTTSNGTRSNQSPITLARNQNMQHENFGDTECPIKPKYSVAPQQSMTIEIETSTSSVSSSSRVNASDVKEFCTWVEPRSKIISSTAKINHKLMNKITGKRRLVLQEKLSMQNTMMSDTENQGKKAFAG